MYAKLTIIIMVAVWYCNATTVASYHFIFHVPCHVESQ